MFQLLNQFPSTAHTGKPMFIIKQEQLKDNFMVPVLYHLVNTKTMEIVRTFRTKHKANQICKQLNGEYYVR